LIRPERLAVLFPGQGSQKAEMFLGLRDHAAFRHRYAIVCHHAQCDLLKRIEAGDEAVLDENINSSLATLLVSSISYDIFIEREERKPDFVAGYSVGQWAALWAAGMIDFEQLASIVATRGRLMNACVGAGTSGMTAIIGIRESELERVLGKLREEGHAVYLSNDNCPGQYSISGTLSALGAAETELAPLRPRKMVRLPVSGAWHCALLDRATVQFGDILREVDFRPAGLPVIDNVTGDFLPAGETELKEALARQISRPVRWQGGIRRLIGDGTTRFVEVGFDNMLSKFLFFIDRDVDAQSFYRD